MGETTCDNCVNYKKEGCFKCEGYVPKKLTPLESFTLFMDGLEVSKDAEYRVLMETYLEKAAENEKKLDKINDILNMYYHGEIDDPIDVVDLICDVA